MRTEDKRRMIKTGGPNSCDCTANDGCIVNILSQVHNTHKCNEKLSLAMTKAGQEMYEAKLWVGLGPGLVDDLVTRLHCG